MGVLLMVLGILSIGVGFWWLVISLFTKSPKKRPAQIFVAGFAVLIFGAIITPSDSAEEEIKREPAEEGTNEEVVEVTDQTTQDRLTEMLETNTPFDVFADEYFALPQDEQSAFFEDTLNGANVSNWSGIVLQAQANNVMMYGGDPSLYNGEDWITLMSEKPELIPYVVNASIPSKSQVAEVGKGDVITVNGGITRAGNSEEPVVWMLENALLVDIN